METKKRTHKDNLARITAADRVEDLRMWWTSNGGGDEEPLWRAIERALQAHAREALARAKRRRDDWYATGKGTP